MIDGNEKWNCQLAFELQNSRAVKSAVKVKSAVTDFS